MQVDKGMPTVLAVPKDARASPDIDHIGYFNYPNTHMNDDQINLHITSIYNL